MHQTMQAGSKHNRHLHIGTAEKMTAMNEAIDLNNEGMQLMNRGQYAQAHDKFERSLAIKENLYGHDNSMVALSLMNLGDNYLNWGKLDLAEEAGKEALRIRRAIGDPEARYAEELLDDVRRARKKAAAAATTKTSKAASAAASTERAAATKSSKQAQAGSSTQAAAGSGICSSSGGSSEMAACAACGVKGVTKSSEATPDKPHLSRCGRCKSVYYCGKECQTKDWPAHKKKCKEVADA